MLISLTRAGGFAGLTMAASVDTATLPPAEARHLETLVEGLDWPALRRGVSPPPGARDLLEYEITVTRPSGEAEHASLSEPGLPPQARPLIDALMARAAPQR